ncbi:MAG: Fructose-bisphosphate aldolase, partial [Candidatus Woesebacteria bacterium GW2011_GWB1_45_5]
MEETIQKLLAPTKGILANDESTGTITKRFAALGLTSTPELNRIYRQMLVTTPGIEKFISGIIFYDETVRQNIDSGEIFPDYVSAKGIIPGVKADEGLESFEGSEQEATKGLENLPGKFDEYLNMGIKFTKWRGIFNITDIYP